jgi:hypothetical protein
VLPAAVLPQMLEREPGRRRSVGCWARHHPRLAQDWIRARGVTGGAGDAQMLQELLATRKARCVSQAMSLRGGVGVGEQAAGSGSGSGCLCRCCYQALAAVGSASWRVGQPVWWWKNAPQRSGWVTDRERVAWVCCSSHLSQGEPDSRLLYTCS